MCDTPIGRITHRLAIRVVLGAGDCAGGEEGGGVEGGGRGGMNESYVMDG